jgi:CRISPR/Cas system type I-B associated protein Csh2 (Cas7 group RAMP superfamily)
MHAVNENEEHDSLTSVIATQKVKEQGGFDLDDHRIQYGLIRFHGLVDEHGAEDTKLTTKDVERLVGLKRPHIGDSTSGNVFQTDPRGVEALFS